MPEGGVAARLKYGAPRPIALTICGSAIDLYGVGDLGELGDMADLHCFTARPSREGRWASGLRSTGFGRAEGRENNLSDSSHPKISAGNYSRSIYTQGKWQLLVSLLRVQS